MGDQFVGAATRSHHKMAVLGAISEVARFTEQPWREGLPLTTGHNQATAELIADWSRTALQIAERLEQLTAGDVLLASVHQVCGASTWAEQREHLQRLAANALNWILAGDRAVHAPLAPPVVPEPVQ